MKIRELVESDRQVWQELFAGYLVFYKTELTNSQIDLTWERILDSTYNLYGKVAEINGILVGITHYSYQTSTWAPIDYCYLEDLYVDPENRGAGIGRALIESVKDEAVAHGSSRLYWNTDVTNTTARKLYDSFTLESGKIQYRVSLSD